MAKSIAVEEISANPVQFQQDTPSNPSDISRGVYTQQELANKLLVSVTTVKKYLKRLREIYVWMGDAEWTDARGRYPEKVLEYLFDYQANCGVARVEGGQLVDNHEAIGFGQYKAHTWNRYQYVEQPLAEPRNPVEAVPVTVDGEIVGPAPLAISKNHGMLRTVESLEANSEAIEMISDRHKNLIALARTLGKREGKAMASVFNAAKTETFLSEVGNADQALIDAIQSDG